MSMWFFLLLTISFYTDGENAQTPQERQEAFNQALQYYRSLPQSSYGNGKLQYNIGNTYYQLGQYPFALLYYYKALRLRPEDPAVLHNLNKAQSKLGLRMQEETFSFLPTLPQALQLFIGLVFLSFFLFSVRLWAPKTFAITWPVFTLVLSLIPLCFALYFYYLAPTEAVVVRGTNLYRGAGEQFAKVVDDPVSAGSRVELIEIVECSQTEKPCDKWLKIKMQDGSIGYVSEQAVRQIF